MLVACAEWRGINYSKSDVSKNTTDIIQRQNFWTEGNDVKKVLEPLIRVLRLVDGDGSISGHLYEAMERSREGIRHVASENPSRYDRILQLMEIRKEENNIHEVHEAVAFLNPAYMCREDFNNTRGMKAGIMYMVDFLVVEKEKSYFLKEVQQYIMKSKILFTPVTNKMIRTSHHKIWWDYCGDSLPTLQKHDVGVLSLPCSSSACERHWSAFEAAQTKKRNRLTLEMLDRLVSVRMSTIAREKYGELEARDLEPINLNNLLELPDYVHPPVDGDNGVYAEFNYEDDTSN